MKRILVVDDDDDTAEALRDLLVGEGYAVEIALGARKALACLEASAAETSLVLLDLVMPEMSGVQLVDELAARPELAAIPVVAMTAALSATTPRGARAVISKMIDPDALIALVGEVVGPP